MGSLISPELTGLLSVWLPWCATTACAGLLGVSWICAGRWAAHAATMQRVMPEQVGGSGEQVGNAFLRNLYNSRQRAEAASGLVPPLAAVSAGLWLFTVIVWALWASARI